MPTTISDAEDLNAEAVLATLRGENTELSPSTALSLLPQCDADPAVKVSTLTALIEREASIGTRGIAFSAAAVRTLGVVGTLGVEAAIDSLRLLLSASSDGRLVGEAVLALSWLGTEQDIPLVQEAASRVAWPFAELRAAAAARLLAHRNGVRLQVPDPRLDVPRLAPREATSDVEPLDLSPEVHDLVSTLMSTGRAGVRGEDLEARAGFRCGGRLHVVLVSRDAVRRVDEVPLLAGIVLAQVEETGDLTPAYVILTMPEDHDAVSALVTLPTGEPVYLGTGTTGARGVSIVATALERPGAVASEMVIDVSPAGDLRVTGRSEASTRQRLIPTADPGRVYLNTR